MKKLILALTLFVGCAPSWASTLSDAIDSMQENTKFTALDGVAVGSFQSFKQGNDTASQGSITSHVLTYKGILTLDLSWAYAFTGSKDGTGLGGPGIKIRELLMTMFPTLNLKTPTGNVYFDKIISSTFVNYSAGWRTEDGSFDYGPLFGLETKFGD